jgi:hypothetical protein
MSLTASTCITFTGYEPLGDTLYIYSDSDGFTVPFTNVSTDDITGGNCPYIITGIPEGTSILQFRDPESTCCATISIQDNDLCNTCNLSFTNYSTSTVGQLIVGDLVGTCDTNISDYVINWYQSGNSEVYLTTGYGTAFSGVGWNLTHPLTGNSSPIIESGTYTPVIDRVIINGATFTSSGGSETFPANLDCFQSQQVTVNSFTCSNGNTIGDYSHHYLFDNYSVGVPPQSLSATFTISSNTNYLAWKFQGFDVADTLKMTFYGSAYGNEPILIENLQIGQDALPFTSTGTSVNAQPKKVNSYNIIKKVTCLTGLTINNNDYVIISVIPSQTNYNTKWDFYFQCLETFDCTTCLDNYKNAPYKIVLSSVTAFEIGCNVVNVNYQLSGCSLSDLQNTDKYKYYDGGVRSNFRFTPINYSYNMYFNNQNCQTYVTSTAQSKICGPQGSNITYNKQISNGQGLFTITCTSITDLQVFYNSYLNILSYSGTPTDNTNINYYRHYNLKVPTGNSAGETCGDSTPYSEYNFHTSTVVTTGGTGPYTMTLTMPTIVDNINFNCAIGCDSRVSYVVNAVNNSSLNQNNNLNFTTTTGSKYIDPFWATYVVILNYPLSAVTDEYSTVSSLPTYTNVTYPYSGINNTFIPSLSAKTCNYTDLGYVSNVDPIEFITFQHSHAKVTLLDENNLTYFKIEQTPITNFRYSGYPGNAQYEIALIYSSGTITYSNPVYCI